MISDQCLSKDINENTNLFNSSKKIEESKLPLNKIFGFNQQNIVKCPDSKCKYESTTTRFLNDLTLNINDL